MDKQGVGMDMWTSLQNAQLDHIPTPPTRAYPQDFRLRPDALRLPNIHLKMNSGTLNTKYQDRGHGFCQNRGNAVQLHMKTGIA
jgi:hypothetical protein